MFNTDSSWQDSMGLWPVNHLSTTFFYPLTEILDSNAKYLWLLSFDQIWTFKHLRITSHYYSIGIVIRHFEIYISFILKSFGGLDSFLFMTGVNKNVLRTHPETANYSTLCPLLSLHMWLLHYLAKLFYLVLKSAN